jgi:hypothetical protein
LQTEADDLSGDACFQMESQLTTWPAIPALRRKDLESQFEPTSHVIPKKHLHLVYARPRSTRSPRKQPKRTIGRAQGSQPYSQRQQPEYDFGPFEQYVDEHVIAAFLRLEPRQVLEMARARDITAHPIGGTRKRWRFRISEVAADMEARKRPARAKMPQAVPGTKERNRLG